MMSMPPPHHISTDLPTILVLPASLVGQPVEQWQTIVRKIYQPLLATATLEWDWVNLELGALNVETLRELVGRLSFGVGPTGHHLVVILAADLAPAQAQNALLKSLEEPPDRTTLILVVTSPSALLETVISRCRIEYVTEGSSLANPATNSTDGAAALATLTQFSQAPTTFTHSQLIQLASQYKDRVSAQSLLRQWLTQLNTQPTSLTLTQIKLAQATLVALVQLDQNLSPSLVLERLFFSML